MPTKPTNLDLTHLKGTHQLKPALHGFYIDDRVYAKARAAILPTSYELHKKERLKLKLAQEREDRVKLFVLEINFLGVVRLFVFLETARCQYRFGN